MVMAQFIMIVQLVIQLFPQVLALVKAIEEAFPQGQLGASKLAMVRASLETTFQHLQGASVTFEQVWPTLEKMIAAAVALYKAKGDFK
jgi:hypothetical protein